MDDSVGECGAQFAKDCFPFSILVTVAQRQILSTGFVISGFSNQ
jgi:hypothetical protein